MKVLIDRNITYSLAAGNNSHRVVIHRKMIEKLQLRDALWLCNSLRDRVQDRSKALFSYVM